MKVHCLFEQSGTFKNAFKSLGYNAFDYDIENQFNQTDYVIDLFKEITKAENGDFSVFDLVSSDDLVLAFFPCTYFSVNNWLMYDYRFKNYSKSSDLQIIESCEKRLNLFARYFGYFCSLYSLALNRGFKLVIENPYNRNSLLYKFFPFSPSVIDIDRRLTGDKFKKPTMYYFVNCSPLYNFFLEPVYVSAAEKDIMHTSPGIARSLISEPYAERFIKTHLIPYGRSEGGVLVG